MTPRPTTASKRARVTYRRPAQSILEHAHQLLIDNGIAVDAVYRVESAGFAYSGKEEILFSDLDDRPKTAILTGNIDKSDGAIEVTDGWS